MNPQDLIHVILTDNRPDEGALFIAIIKRNSLNIRLTVCGGAEELFCFLNTYEFNLPTYLFLDVNMPGKDGIECLKYIRTNSLWCHLPIIMYAINAEKEAVEKAFICGADYYFKKPDDIDALPSVFNWLIFSKHFEHRKPSRDNFLLAGSIVKMNQQYCENKMLL